MAQIDPTQGARDAVGNFLKKLVPANSPLAQSGSSAVVPQIQDQVAVKNAAIENPVKVDAQPEDFVEQQSSQPVQAPQAQDIGQGYVKAANMEAAAQENLGKQESAVLNKQAEMINQQQADEQAIQLKQESDLAEIEKERKVAQNDLDSKKIEPHGFFHNKSGWEKIIGGIGLFLGSITPEGARNVASIINKEIERDTESQKLDYQLRKGKVDAISNRYKANIEKYKDDKLARLAMQREKLLATDYQLKGLQAVAKGPTARAKAEAGKAEIEIKLAEVEQKMFERKQKASDGTIPGYAGVISDPTSARAFRDMVAEAPNVNAEIDNLEKINKGFLGGALSPSATASANGSVQRLIGKLRVALVGPGSMSEGDRALLEDAIANPTDIFSLKSSNALKLKELKAAYQRSVDSNAKVLGLTKNTPTGARKL